MYYYLRDHEDINVQNVAINFYAPKACAELDCEPVWTLKKWWYYTNSCDGYIGGCAPGDERLQVDNWQGLLADETVMPIFQDEYWVDAWYVISSFKFEEISNFIVAGNDSVAERVTSLFTIAKADSMRYFVASVMRSSWIAPMCFPMAPKV